MGKYRFSWGGSRLRGNGQMEEFQSLSSLRLGISNVCEDLIDSYSCRLMESKRILKLDDLEGN